MYNKVGRKEFCLFTLSKHKIFLRRYSDIHQKKKLHLPVLLIFLNTLFELSPIILLYNYFSIFAYYSILFFVIFFSFQSHNINIKLFHFNVEKFYNLLKNISNSISNKKDSFFFRKRNNNCCIFWLLTNKFSHTSKQ